MSPAGICIYEEFPRHVGRAAALKAIERAVKRLVKGEMGIPMIERDAQVFLYRKTQQYATTPAGTNPEKNFIPHPSTFFNQARYLDDPSEWNVRLSNGRKGRTEETIDSGRDFLEDLAHKLGVGKNGHASAGPKAIEAGL